MKRILFFLLLLVNLQLTTDNGSLSIGLGKVSAQRTSEERLPGVETSSKMKKCDQCGREVQEDLLADHKENYCSQNSAEEHGDICGSCKKSEKDCKCDLVGGKCMFCNKPVDFCTCLTIDGKKGKSSGNSASLSVPLGGIEFPTNTPITNPVPNTPEDNTPTTVRNISTGEIYIVWPSRNTQTDVVIESARPQTSLGGSGKPTKYGPSSPPTDYVFVKIRINDFKITFDPGADNPVNKRLVEYLEKILEVAKKQGIKSIQISSTTNHTSNRSKSAHSKANGAKALDINYIDGVHVSTSNYKARMLQEIIRNTSGYRENYGPFIINKIENGKRIEAPWARKIKGGHYDHIHISIP